MLIYSVFALFAPTTEQSQKKKTVRKGTDEEREKKLRKQKKEKVHIK